MFLLANSVLPEGLGENPEKVLATQGKNENIKSEEQQMMRHEAASDSFLILHVAETLELLPAVHLPQEKELLVSIPRLTKPAGICVNVLQVHSSLSLYLAYRCSDVAALMAYLSAIKVSREELQ